jgi:hypothetical protein
MPQIVMSIAALSLLLIWPLVQSIGSGANGKPGLILLMAGLLMTLFVALDRDFSARYPREASLFHAVDVDRNESFWTSLEAEPGSWAGDFLGENAEVSNLTRIMPGYDKDVVIHDDGLPQIEAATLEVTGDRVVDGLREISLHLQSPSQAEYINLLFQIDVGISSAMANGFAVKVPQIATENQSASDKPDEDKNLDRTNEKDWWRWRWYGMPEQGADIVLRFEPDRRMAVKIIEVDYGMPDEAPPRPDGIMARKYTWSDSRVIFRTQLIE